MSWWRSAVNKVVDAGGKNSVTRRARNYAEAVVQHAGQAVAVGAKILQDSIGALKIQSYRATVKNLEELSVSCTGNERIQLLRKWLVALVEIERLSGTFLDHKETTHEPLPDSNESKDFSRRLLSVLYSDPDLGVEPMIFRDVFLYSQALEGMTLSMILEAPDEEEVSLLVELFGRCLIGGKEVHKAIICSLQELAKAFSRYQEEILAKKGELLQFAQAAMSGLKLNADIARIDAEASFLWQKLDGTKMHLEPLAGDVEGASQRTSMEVVEALTEAFTEIQLCHKLEVLLLRKKSLNNGDLPDVHSRKVDKLRVLSESLANSTLKAENRASDHRLQKDEALKFRVTKASEVMEVEKELAAEVSKLEKQRDELEAQMKEVNTSLAAAYARLKNTREEKLHFDEASAQIIAHLKSKEDELSNSLASYRIEADVINKSISFLEGTWCFQSLYTEKKDKQTNDELEKYEDYFLKLVTHHLSSYEVELSSLLSSFRTLVEQLLNSHEGSDMLSTVDRASPNVLNWRKNLEEECVESESKVITICSVVDSMKEQFYGQCEQLSRKDSPIVYELFNIIKQLRHEFDSIKKPTLQIETLNSKKTPPTGKRLRNNPSLFEQIAGSVMRKKDESSKAGQIEAEIENMESGSGKVKEYPTEEISDWEYD